MWRQCTGPTLLSIYVDVAHIYFQLSVSYFIWVLYHYDFQDLFLRIFLWSKVAYKARGLFNWSIILIDDARGILKELKILLVGFKGMLPALEHLHLGFPHFMGEFLVSVKLYHEFLDELQHFNKILVTLYGFIFDISSKLGDKTLSALSMNNCERHFHILF